MSIKFLKLYYCNFKAIAVPSRFNTSPAATLTKSNKNTKGNFCFHHYLLFNITGNGVDT